MTSRLVRDRRIPLIVLLLAAAAASVAFPPRSDRGTLTAAPPVIRQTDHPYDPDWLEVKWILSRKCLGCHREGTEQSDLSTYEKLLSAESYGEPVVVPGDAEKSTLWQQVAWNVHARVRTSLPDSPEMPPEREEWLTAGQLASVKRWINRGARKFNGPCAGTPPLVETDFPSAKQCQSCHPKQYEEWSRSMHHYAMHSPVFEAFNLTLIERTSGTIGTFCSRCHTPIGTLLGEKGGVRNVHRSRLSLEGVTCIVCHRRSTPHHKSSGRVPIEPGDVLEGCMYGPFESSPAAGQHGAHESAKLPYLKSSQFCGECHDVTSPQGVRLEEAFSEWLNSPAAKAGITCQQCHMGPVQGIPFRDDQRPLGRAAEVPGVDPEKLPLRRLTDHTFAGPDYSLLPDTEFPHKLDWMYEVDYRDTQRLTPYQQKTLLDLRLKNRRQLKQADLKRYELLANAAKIGVKMPEAAACGQTVHIHVDVTSKTAGHNFPTGFTAERQAWVSVTVRDPAGRIVFASGDLDSNGDLRDDHSKAVLTGKLPRDKYLLNFQNKFIALTNKGTEKSVVLSVNRHLLPVNIVRPAPGISASFGRPGTFRISKGSLPPLATIGQRYPVHLPRNPGEYTVQVRLNFRHLPPALLDKIGAGHLKHQLEVFVIDQFESVLVVQ